MWEGSNPIIKATHCGYEVLNFVLKANPNYGEICKGNLEGKTIHHNFVVLSATLQHSAFPKEVTKNTETLINPDTC
jgi:hypothetical protein